ncbi:MAG: glycosyltransferase [Bacteroides graminisolvens]|nr:glycosyltransferase [Bacteroides graminisolvens]
MYFDTLNCDEWKNSCLVCKEKRAYLRNMSSRNFSLKKHCIEKLDKVVFVPVSQWLADIMKESALKKNTIKVIHNGIDIDKFKPLPCKKNSLDFIVLGVAAVWDYRKGLNDFIKLRELLPQSIKIVLVGLSNKQISHLPKGIIGISRTSNLDEMVQIYSDADVFVNPTYSDNFPTTNIEALACGTPVVTYNTGGSPEAIDEMTGIVVERGSVDALAKAIISLKNIPLSASDCRKRAEENFDKKKCFRQYLELYNELLK